MPDDPLDDPAWDGDAASPLDDPAWDVAPPKKPAPKALSVAEQDRAMEPPSVLKGAIKRAIATDPALSLASQFAETVGTLGSEAGIGLAGLVTGATERERQMAREAVNELAPFAMSSTKQAEFLARQEASDPALAAESEARRRMAAGGLSGAAQAGARGLAGASQVAFALQAPIVTGAFHAAGSIPGAEEVLQVPADVGGAVAGALGADEGGVALGRAVGSLAPAGLAIPFARSAGRAAGSGTVGPAARLGTTRLGSLGPALAAEGGLGAILRDPMLRYQGASLAAGLPQVTIPQEVASAAQAYGASPEVAELLGGIGGIASFLPSAGIETALYKQGARAGLERVQAAEAAKAQDQAIRAIRSHEEPIPAPEAIQERMDADFLGEEYRKEAERKKALAGVAGAVEGVRRTEAEKLAEVYPEVPEQPPEAPRKPPVVGKGEPLPEEAYREALEQTVPLTKEQEASNRKHRMELDRLLSERTVDEAKYDETKEWWDGLPAAEKKEVVDALPEFIEKGARIRRRFDNLDETTQGFLYESMEARKAGATTEPPLPADQPPPAEPTPAARPAPIQGERAPPVAPEGTPPTTNAGTFRAFVESRGKKWPLKTDDPDYKGLLSDFQSGATAPPPPAAAAPAKVPVPPKAKKSPTVKVYETRLRTQGKVSVKGTEVELDTTGPDYRVLVDKTEVFKGSAADAFARADQEIARASGGHIAGAGLGGVDFSDPGVRKAARAVVGGSAGYLYALADEEDSDSPEKRAAFRALYAIAGAWGAAGAPGMKRVTSPIRRGVRSAAPRWVKDWFFNPNETISPEFASVVRKRLDSEEMAKVTASKIARPQPFFDHPEANRVWDDYLAGAYGSEKPFRALIARVGVDHPDLVPKMEKVAEDYRSLHRNITADRVRTGITSPEAAAEYPESHAKRIHAPKEESSRRFFGFGSKRNLPKVEASERRGDAPWWEGPLDPTTVELVMDSAGMTKPQGPHTYFKGDDGGTLVKWQPTPEGEFQRQLFLEALGDYAKDASLKNIRPGQIVGGGDPRMVVQVGKGSRGDIGHFAARETGSDTTLLARIPRKVTKEIVDTLGIAAPKERASGNRMRLTFDSAASREAFEGAVRELAVENSTFNITPQAKRYFQNRLRGAKVRMGEGSRGGHGAFTESTGPARTVKQRREAGEIYDPRVVAYKSTYDSLRDIGSAQMKIDIRDGSDGAGRWSVERPAAEEGQRPLRPGDATSVDGTEYVLAPVDRERWGALSDRLVRRDVYDFLEEYHRSDADRKGFLWGMLQKWKALKLATPAWATINTASDFFFAHAAGTAPWQGVAYSKDYLDVARDFIRAIRKGDMTVLEPHIRDAGIRIHEGHIVGNAEAEAVLEGVMGGAMNASSAARQKAGERVMDIASGGVLAGKTVLGSAATGSIGGAAIGAAAGLAEGDPWDEVLLRSLKGAAIGAGAGATAKSISKFGPLIDAYFKAVGYRIMRNRQGLTHEQARQRTRDFFQNYEETSKAVRVASGKTPHAAGALVNPFFAYYSELVRIAKNAVLDNPARAATAFAMVPVGATMLDYFMRIAGKQTFRSEEEERAAKQQFPHAVFHRGDDSLVAANLSRANPGGDFVADVMGTVRDPGADSFLRLASIFGLSTPAVGAIQAFLAARDPEARDIRTGIPIRKPGETGGGTLVRKLAETVGSPLAPEFGTTEQMVERSVTEEYERGRDRRPPKPVRAAARALTGVDVRDVDFRKTSISLIRRRLAEEREADEWLARARKEANLWTDQRRRREALDTFRRMKKDAMDRWKRDRERLLPQESPR